MPPLKSMPKLRPLVSTRMMVPTRTNRRPGERDPAVAEERDLGAVGDETRSDAWQPQSGNAAGLVRSYQIATRKRLKVDRGEHVGDDAEAERHGEALDRAGAELEQRQGRDQRGQVGVDDRAHRLGEAGVDRRQRRPAGAASPRGCARRSGRCESTAWPIVSTMPAMPGRVSVPPSMRHDAEDQDDVEHERDVGDTRRRCHSRPASDRPRGPPRRCWRWCRRGSNRHRARRRPSAPRPRSSGAGRAPARSSTDELVGALDGEAAGDDARAAEDRLADVRGRDHLVVEHDRERLADILLRDPAELARTLRVEAEAHDRLVVLEEGWASVRFSPLSSTCA